MDSVFMKVEFFALIVSSLLLPIGLYAYMMWKRAIARDTLPMIGIDKGNPS